MRKTFDRENRIPEFSVHIFELTLTFQQCSAFRNNKIEEKKKKVFNIKFNIEVERTKKIKVNVRIRKEESVCQLNENAFSKISQWDPIANANTF